MRKAVAWAIGVLMLVGSLGMAPALAADDQDEQDEQDLLSRWMPPTEALILHDPIGIQAGSKLVVGTTTRMSGYFSTEMWGMNAADMDVRALLHGYETVSWTRFGSLQFNSVVMKSAAYETVGGEGLYTMEIYDDLTYSDGSKVTAEDYVFSLLLSSAREIADIGGTPQGWGYLKGFSAYHGGETEVFAGIRLLSETQFQLIIPGDFLPYFYGVAMLRVQPYPVAVIAPGCEVRDDGKGAYIVGEFSAAMLQETMLNPQTGYVFNPQVTSGPYTLDSYDAENSVITFQVNPNFKGNSLGKKPNIERIEVRLVAEADAIKLLATGEIGLINKIMDDEMVFRGIDGVGEQNLRMASYPRNGLGFLGFSCEKEPANSQAVRQALMMAIDRDAIIEKSPQTMSATRVEGYYGMGQWMVGYWDGGRMDGQPTLSVPEKLVEMRKPVDMKGAKALLDSDGWVMNQAGEPFDAKRDAVRYKRHADGYLQPLKLSIAMAEEMTMGPAVCKELQRALPELGIGVEVVELPFPELLRHYYRQVERKYDVFFMGTNFNYLFDPYYSFHTSPAYQGMLNTSGLQDEKLMELALDMRRTNSMDTRGYVEKWLLFQERFMEMVPLVPLYSNIYFDFYRKDLWGYNPVTSPSWSLAVPYAYISDEPLLGENQMDLPLDPVDDDEDDDMAFVG